MSRAAFSLAQSLQQGETTGLAAVFAALIIFASLAFMALVVSILLSVRRVLRTIEEEQRYRSQERKSPDLRMGDRGP